MSRKKWMGCLAGLASLVLITGGALHAQYNPNGWIQTRGWNYTFLCNPRGCGAITPAEMLENPVAPHSIFAENPKAGTSWSDVPATPGYPCVRDGGLASGAVFWSSNEFLEATFALGDGSMPNGDLADWDAVIGDINARIIPLVPGTTAISNDSVLGIATTYVENTGPPLSIEICQSSDDGIQTWVNNIRVTNVDVCRGSVGGCSELTPAVLPSGFSQIQMLVWEEGGGFNGRLGIRVAGSGVNLADGNGVINFVGTGFGNDVALSQEQYTINRSAPLAAFNCPNFNPKVTLTGSGPGDPSDLLTVIESVEAQFPAEIQISNVTNGGVVADKLPPAPPPTRPVGAFQDHVEVGVHNGPASDTTYNSGTGVYASVSNSGGDLWDGSNDFEFAYSEISGNFDVSCKILSRTHSTGTGRWGKFGLIARQAIDGCSRHSIIQDHMPDLQDFRSFSGRTVHNTCGSMFEERGETGADVSDHPPYYRLKRVGNVLTGWASDNAAVETDPTNDANWTQIGPADDWGAGAPAKLFVGYANSEHNDQGTQVQTIEFKLLSFPSTGKFQARATIGTDAGSLPSNTTFDLVTEEYTSTSTTAGDLWDGSNDFEFIYSRIEGDFDISIKETSKTHSGAGRWGKFGLIARQQLDGCSRHTIIQDHLADLQDFRSLSGRLTNNVCGTMYEERDEFGPDVSDHPIYYRLKRTGNVIRGYAADDAAVETDCGNDALWTRIGREDDWGGDAPSKLFVGFANSEHGDQGENVQTIKFKVLCCIGTQVPLFDTEPIGKTITWTDVTRSAVSGGELMYNLNYNASGATTLSGNAPGVAITGGLSSINFTQGVSGPVGEWDTSHDIGNVPAQGSTTYDASTGTYVSSGTGNDIWDGGDDFHYAYKVVTGDFLAECRIAGISDPGGGTRWGRFGLMARWTCDRNSKYSMSVELGSDNVDTPRHQFRVGHLNNGGTRDHYQMDDGFFADDGLGGADVSADGNPFPAGRRRPAWMRLVRIGPAIYSYFSNSDGSGNPAGWKLAGSDSATNMPASMLLGMAVSAHGSAGPNLLSITYDRFRCVPLDKDCTDLASLLFETASTRDDTSGLGSTPYTPLLVPARIPVDAADADANGGSGYGVKNRNWVWRDLTVGSENLEGTIQLLWNNENRNFNPDGPVPSLAVTPLLRFAFSQVSRAYIAWDARHVAGGQDNPDGTVNNGWFDFNNAVGTVNAQGWLRIGGSSVVDPGADIIQTNSSADGGDDNFARGGVWSKDFDAGDVLETFQTGIAGGRSPYVVFIRCGQACSKSSELASLDFEDGGDLGVAVQGGGFAPGITGGRLRVTDETVAGTANAVWYGVVSDPGAGGAPILDDGFLVEFDAFMTRTGLLPDGNPADGFGFVAMATGVNDGLASAVSPFPTGLGITDLRGDGGGAIAYEGNTLRQRTDAHPSFAVEMDNWVGGGEPGNEPGDGGSPNNDGNWHIGIDVNASVSSIQTNVNFGVPTGELPDIFNAQGAHIEVMYRPDGAINVWASGVDKSGAPVARRQLLSTYIPPMPSGDVIVGFVGGTGGATCTQEIDNFKLSAICCEFPDGVSITGPAGTVKGTPAALSAVVTGADQGGTATYSWAVVSGSATIDDPSAATVNVTPTDLAPVVVEVSFDDGTCGNSVTAQHTITVSPESCDLSIACSRNPDNVSVHIAGTVTGPGPDCNCDQIVVYRDGTEIFRGAPAPDGMGDFPLPPGCFEPTQVTFEVACLGPAGEGARGSCSVTCQPSGGVQFPGDCNQDGKLTLADAICVLNYLFLGEDPAVLPCAGGDSSTANKALLDANGDNGAGTGRIDIGDAIFLLNRIALGGPPHVLGESCVLILDCPSVSPCPGN